MKRNWIKFIIDDSKLRAELARRRVTLLELARRMKRPVPVSTLSTWLRGAVPAPIDLGREIERALGLADGFLAPAAGAEEANSAETETHTPDDLP